MKQSKAKQYSFTLHMYVVVRVVTKWPLQWILRWSICPLDLLLALGSHDLSQAEREIVIVFKAEQIHKMKNIFTQNDIFVHPGQFWVSFSWFAHL